MLTSGSEGPETIIPPIHVVNWDVYAMLLTHTKFYMGMLYISHHSSRQVNILLTV